MANVIRLAADKAEGVTLLRREEGRSVFKVESGVYRFVSSEER